MFLFNRMKYFIDGKKVKKKYFDFNLKMKLMVAESNVLTDIDDIEFFSAEDVINTIHRITSKFNEKLKEIEINGSVKVLNSVYEIRR